MSRLFRVKKRTGKRQWPANPKQPGVGSTPISKSRPGSCQRLSEGCRGVVKICQDQSIDFCQWSRFGRTWVSFRVSFPFRSLFVRFLFPEVPFWFPTRKGEICLSFPFGLTFLAQSARAFGTPRHGLRYKRKRPLWAYGRGGGDRTPISGFGDRRTGLCATPL